MQIDYKNRPVVYFGNNIAIVKDINSYLVVTGLYEAEGKLNYREINFFARTKDEAEEVVRDIVRKIWL